MGVGQHSNVTFHCEMIKMMHMPGFNNQPIETQPELNALLECI